MKRQTAQHRIFKLNQNYPNPVTYKTTIHFALYQNEFVELAIYNIIGQKVKTLIGGFLQTGSYLIDWDGRDDSGQFLDWGEYIYKLQTKNGQAKIRKLRLLRQAL